LSLPERGSSSGPRTAWGEEAKLPTRYYPPLPSEEETT